MLNAYHHAVPVVPILAAFAGGKIGLFIAETVPQMPPWMTYTLGPFGALIAVVIGLVWVSKRLNKADEREDERRKERDAMLKELTVISNRSNDVIERNSEVLDKIESHLKK